MRKFFLVILGILLCSSFVFAQKAVNEVNGFDWVTWEMPQKLGFIQGFYSAYFSILDFSNDTIDESNPNKVEMLKQVQNQFYISLTVAQLGQRIEQAYSDYDNRKWPIWQVVVMASGKAWWNNQQSLSPSPIANP